MFEIKTDMSLVKGMDNLPFELVIKIESWLPASLLCKLNLRRKDYWLIYNEIYPRLPWDWLNNWCDLLHVKEQMIQYTKEYEVSLQRSYDEYKLDCNDTIQDFMTMSIRLMNKHDPSITERKEYVRYHNRLVQEHTMDDCMEFIYGATEIMDINISFAFKNKFIRPCYASKFTENKHVQKSFHRIHALLEKTQHHYMMELSNIYTFTQNEIEEKKFEKLLPKETEDINKQ